MPRVMNFTRWTLEQVIQIAKDARQLAESKKAEMEPRVSAGLFDGLPGDISQIEALTTGRPAHVVEVKGLTGTEAEIAAKGAALVSAVRESVRRRDTGTGLPKAVGVGSKVYGGRTKSVASSLEAILKAAEEYPDGMRQCGILEADLQKVRTILDSLVGARDSQDNGMKTKKNLTAEKNRVQMRLEKAVDEISTAGYLQFMDTDPVLAARFKNLIPVSNGNGKKGGTPEQPETKKA